MHDVVSRVKRRTVPINLPERRSSTLLFIAIYSIAFRGALAPHNRSVKSSGERSELRTCFHYEIRARIALLLFHIYLFQSHTEKAIRKLYVIAVTVDYYEYRYSFTICFPFRRNVEYLFQRIKRILKRIYRPFLPKLVYSQISFL